MSDVPCSGSLKSARRYSFNDSTASRNPSSCAFDGVRSVIKESLGKSFADFKLSLHSIFPGEEV